MKEESLLLLSDLQKLINQVVLIDYIIIILGGKYWEDGGEYFEAYKLIDWYPIYPIKRETIILPECMYPSGFLNKYDFES